MQYNGRHHRAPRVSGRTAPFGMLLQTAALGQDYLYGRGGRRNFPVPALLEQFQEKCAAVFRPELRQKGEQFQEKFAAVFRPELRQKGDQFQEKFAAVFRPELRQRKVRLWITMFLGLVDLKT
jgi:hypothetical protein